MTFSIGPLTIHVYGIILMLGAVAGATLASYEAKRRGENPDLVWDGLLWALIGGVIGARVWHILTPPQSMIEMGITTRYYLTHPLDAIAIWKGGLGIPGAVLGGMLGMWLFTRRNGLRFGLWADIAAPGLALGQAIGRWGNFVNQELYGAPTDLPWAIHIDPQYRLPGFEQYTTYHPLFLYESLWNLLNMAALLFIARRFRDRLRAGDVFLAYLIIYPVGRFFLEFLRLDISPVSGLNVNQTLMGTTAILAALALFWRHRRR